MDFLAEFYAPAIVGICLCVGYIIKQWVADVSNKLIPTICGILGVALAVWINWNTGITADVLLTGLVSGLASTGMHQAFKMFVDKS